MSKPAKVKVFAPGKVSSNALRRMKAGQYNAARNKRYEKAAALRVELAEVIDRALSNDARASDGLRIKEIRKEIQALGVV